MKHRIFGRKVGATNPMVRLIESDAPTTGGQAVDSGVLDDFTVANAGPAVQALRAQGIEGGVLFSYDPTPCAFSPDADFVYPAARY